MSKIDEKNVKTKSADKLNIGRRKLLKGTSAIPVIMTLHSGAALAVTSNLVGSTDLSDPDLAVDAATGDIFCVNYDTQEGQKYDLGDPSYTIIDKDLTDEEKQAACNGIWMSAIAFNSIEGRPGGWDITT